MAIDGPVVAGVFHTLIVIARAQQAVNVQTGNTLQREHDGVGAHETGKPHCVYPSHCALQGIKQRDVHFVGVLLTAFQGTPGHLSAEALQRL